MEDNQKYLRIGPKVAKQVKFCIQFHRNSSKKERLTWKIREAFCNVQGAIEAIR